MEFGVELEELAGRLVEGCILGLGDDAIATAASMKGRLGS